MGANLVSMPQLEMSMARYRLARNMMEWNTHAMLSSALALGSSSSFLSAASLLACATASKRSTGMGSGQEEGEQAPHTLDKEREDRRGRPEDEGWMARGSHTHITRNSANI